eukprot:scaffold5200_cov162-Pinguiococcus_pyrenoidosus.AAC.1
MPLIAAVAAARGRSKLARWAIFYSMLIRHYLKYMPSVLQLIMQNAKAINEVLVEYANSLIERSIADGTREDAHVLHLSVTRIAARLALKAAFEFLKAPDSERLSEVERVRRVAHEGRLPGNITKNNPQAVTKLLSLHIYGEARLYGHRSVTIQERDINQDIEAVQKSAIAKEGLSLIRTKHLPGLLSYFKRVRRDRRSGQRENRLQSLLKQCNIRQLRMIAAYNNFRNIRISNASQKARAVEEIEYLTWSTSRGSEASMCQLGGWPLMLLEDIPGHRLLQLGRKEVSAICVERGLNSSGTLDMMTFRLLTSDLC